MPWWLVAIGWLALKSGLIALGVWLLLIRPIIRGTHWQRRR